MGGLKKLMKVLTLKSYIINTVLGILLIIALVFIYKDPYNKHAFLLASSAGGLINIINGIKIIKDPVKKMTGMTFLMTGVFIIVIGYIITQYFMK
jgi:hypothetical protein